MTDALLGGAFASRITKNIREDKGYTYSPYSELSVRYRDAYWAENADVTTTVTGPSIKEIFAEIDRLQAEPPAADELTGIQNYLAGTYVLQNSSRGGITNQLSYMDLHGLPPTYASTYVKQVYAVTPQQVTEMAKKHLQDDRAIDRHRRRSQSDRGAGQGVRQHHGEMMPPELGATRFRLSPASSCHAKFPQPWEGAIAATILSSSKCGLPRIDRLWHGVGGSAHQGRAFAGVPPSGGCRSTLSGVGRSTGAHINTVGLPSVAIGGAPALDFWGIASSSRGRQDRRRLELLRHALHVSAIGGWPIHRSRRCRRCAISQPKGGVGACGPQKELGILPLAPC